MFTKNQGLARDPEGEISRTGTRVSLFLPLGVILSSFHGSLGVPLAQLKLVGTDKTTAQAIADWQYWVAHENDF
jgi:hypothetical protein